MVQRWTLTGSLQYMDQGYFGCDLTVQSFFIFKGHTSTRERAALPEPDRAEIRRRLLEKAKKYLGYLCRYISVA